MIDLGINSDSINHEVALEILGQARQPLMSALRVERAKPEPSPAFIKYCESRLAAIDELQDNLTVTDVSTIARILDKESRASWL